MATEQPVENARNLCFADLAGLVIHRDAVGVENYDVRDVTLIVFFDKVLLLRGLRPVQINDHKLHFTLIFLVETYGTASLPLGVESTLAKHEKVIGLALDCARFEVIAGNKRTVLAIARIVESRIQAQVLGSPKARCATQSGSQKNPG